VEKDGNVWTSHPVASVRCGMLNTPLIREKEDHGSEANQNSDPAKEWKLKFMLLLSRQTPRKESKNEQDSMTGN